ncbi:hypothetical protein PybrP1_003155 [[Pythium] brassicae (nom. inval.)]|nr:hypothetical protein PybrP1_003155 [[Pythium] brassicae (nom. inval.)]
MAAPLRLVVTALFMTALLVLVSPSHAQTLAPAPTVLAGYSAMPLSPELEESFIKIAANTSFYSATVTKRVCVLSVESAWKATYASVQLNYVVTGCDVNLGLLAQSKFPSKAAVAKELGRCSASMAKACAASRLRASFEILEKSPSMVWYLSTDALD